MKKIIALCSAILLSACVGGTSKAPNIYSLKTTDSVSTAVAQSTGTSAGISVGVAEVKVPSYIDRPQIILVESDGITLKKSEFERWSEDLATLAQRTLAGDISAYLPGAIVKSKNFINEKFDFVVYVEINDMTGTFADKATLDVWWTIVDNDNNMVFKKQTKIQNELGDTYTDFVIAQSNLLDLLSKEIATELTRLSNPQD